MKIAGAVALVTGANRGIGAAIVEALVVAGASRVYAAARTPSPPSGDKRIVPIALDVTDAAQVARVAAEHGDVQIVVNNAGIATGQSLIGAARTDGAESEMAVNYFGTLHVCRAFAPVLGRNGGGALVNVGSILGRVNLPSSGSYSASKAAAYSLTQGVRAELAAQKTLVIGLMPGFVDTDMTRRLDVPKLAPADVDAALIGAIQEGIEDVYPGDAADIAAALLTNPKAVEHKLRGGPKALG